MKTIRLKKILPYFFIAIICTVLFAKPLINGDEFWNYNFAKNIADGLLPYRDFNIIQTPLSAYLAGLFLSIFGKGLIVYRVLGYFLAVSIYCITYHLCEKISKTSFISFICVLFLFGVHFPYFIYNYNYLSILLLLIIFEIEITDKKETTRRHITVGFLAGLSVLLKQSTGAFIVLANFVTCLYYLRHSNCKKSVLVSRMLMSGIPALIYILYLWVSGTFFDFWEYAVKGIGTFSHRTTPIELIMSGPGNLIFLIIVIAGYFFIFKKIVKCGAEKSLISALAFNLAWIVVAYPLCDATHFLCLLIPLAPAVFICVTFQIYRNWEKYVCIAVSVLVCVVAIASFSAIGDSYVISDLENYQGVVIDSDINERIEMISLYIKVKNSEGYNVRMAADSACAYKIPLNTYEKNWDMLLVGNIGNNDVESLLQENTKTIYLVHKDSSVLGKQNYFDLIEYIKKNYVKIDEVLNFDVYKAPN